MVVVGRQYTYCRPNRRAGREKFPERAGKQGLGASPRPPRLPSKPRGKASAGPRWAGVGRCGPEGRLAFGQAGTGPGAVAGLLQGSCMGVAEAGGSSEAHSAGGTACRSVAARPRWPPPARATHLSSSQVGFCRKSLGCNWLRLVRYGTAAQNVGLAACGGRLAGTWRRPREGVVGPHRAGF